MSTDTPNKELRILAMMRQTLTGIIRETAVPAGTRSQFSDTTLANIRDTLTLIDARQRELRENTSGKVVPLYPDQRAAVKSATVRVEELLKSKKPDR